MKTKIRAIGNSRGLIIPSELLEGTGLQEGDEVEVFRDADRILINNTDPSRRRDFIKGMEEILAEDDEIFRELADR